MSVPPPSSAGLRQRPPYSSAQREKYLAGKFGEHLEPALVAMVQLAAAHEPVDLDRRRFRLYERFWREVPAGELGWGALGELDFAKGTGSEVSVPAMPSRGQERISEQSGVPDTERPAPAARYTSCLGQGVDDSRR